MRLPTCATPLREPLEALEQGKGCDYESIDLQPGFAVALTRADSLNAIDRPKVFPGDRSFIHFNCQLSGTLEAKIRDHTLCLSPGDLSMGFSDGEVFHLRHSPEFCSVAVMVFPKLLSTLLGERESAIPDAGAPQFFVRSSRPNRQAFLAATHIAQALERAPFQRLRIHSAALDFLHWHLRVFVPNECRTSLSAQERRQLSAARELLLADLSDPPTIPQLAKKVGLNQCSLKRGFKLLYGSSIYAHFQAARMQRASQLLESKSVTETAFVLGYNNVSHFSAAFRRHFGLLPSTARKEQVSSVATPTVA